MRPATGFTNYQHLFASNQDKYIDKIRVDGLTFAL